jgi:DNA replication protein DnaC
LLKALGERILSRPCAPPCEANEPDEQHLRGRRAERRWRALIQAIGSRYESCRLENFELSGEFPGKAAAVEQLRRLAASVCEHVRAGGNMILYGPPGTGKDHLLVALLRAAIFADLSADWMNGQDLFGELRDRIGSDTSEERSVRKYCQADVLGISDPVPPRGQVSGYSATMLYRIVDRRYRELKSTWITVNVSDAAEATRELSGPVFDRLSDNCIAVFCNWPSYRRRGK